MATHHSLLTVLGSQCASQSALLMSSPWWGSSPQSWDDDERRGGQWQQESHESPAGKKDKEKDRDRFKNVTSLGATGKHSLSLEDRKSLLWAVMELLSQGGTPVLSKITVSRFSVTTVHALLFLLCHAVPRMSIRLLRDEDGVFTLDYAAQQLAETAASLHQPEALADPRWVPGAVGFRFGSGATEGTGGTRGTEGGGVTTAGPGRARCKGGSDLVQVWLGWGQGRVRFGSYFVHIWFSMDRMWFGCGMGSV